MDQALPGFCAPGIDRADAVRSDPAALERAFADPRAGCLRLEGLDPVLDGAMLWRDPLPTGARIEDYVLLGLEEGGAPLFVRLARNIAHGGTFAPRVWEMAAMLHPEELAIYGGARSLVDWHARHGFCAVCGGTTVIAKAGWSRICPHCDAEHFPRVDPVTIMLAEYDGRVLVGRQRRFPPGRYSALAGFIEPGETIEGAVARELMEEAGVRATRVDYVKSQPWPFPSSLMIACIAQVESDALTLDATEIEDAFWVDRQQVRAALAGEEGAPFIAPPTMAVAHHLFRVWLERAEPGI